MDIEQRAAQLKAALVEQGKSANTIAAYMSRAKAYMQSGLSVEEFVAQGRLKSENEWRARRTATSALMALEGPDPRKLLLESLRANLEHEKRNPYYIDMTEGHASALMRSEHPAEYVHAGETPQDVRDRRVVLRRLQRMVESTRPPAEG